MIVKATDRFRVQTADRRLQKQTIYAKRVVTATRKAEKAKNGEKSEKCFEKHYNNDNKDLITKMRDNQQPPEGTRFVAPRSFDNGAIIDKGNCLMIF